MPVNLTAPAVAKIKPGDAPIQLVDKSGLVLRIGSAATGGAKTWSMRYRIGRRQRRITFGDFDALSLADARQRVRDAKKLIADGIDPAEVKQERRDADTFEQLATDYIAKHAKKKKRSWKEDQRMLNADILPFWKNRLARDITRRDIRERVEAVAERAPIMANRVVALLTKLFAFALDREIIDTSPAVKITRPGTEHKRDRVLTHQEIRTFWTATEVLDAPMRAFFRLRLLTAQRGVEVGTMRWEDVDLDRGWWTIPATVAKNKLSHRVPLSPLAVALLKTLRADADALVAAREARGDTRSKPPVYALADARGKRQQAEATTTFKIADFRGHDLRRTAASLMAGSGTPRLVISKILNHVETGVTAVYDRHGYDAEKRIALDAWGRTLTGILEDKKANVVPFARG